jgi:uncharacterized protein (TIGR03437 family)
MPRFLACRPLFTCCAAIALAQAIVAQPVIALPVISGIENNYSYIPAGLPNSGIAQGSIFVIFGSNLATPSSGLQGLPLQATLDGVSVQFTVQGATMQALLYYVMPNQIAGILPSATPIGTGTVTVTSGGQPSAPAPVTVVQSAIGFATIANQAIAYDVNWNLLGPSNAANPGDIVVLYGSGAGPVTGDESIQQTPQNLSNIPLEVDISGIPATVDYHGRSIYPGVDQFNVVVPAGAVGCNVSVVARSGDIVSNFAFIPVAVGSRVCSDQVPGVTPNPDLTLTGKSSYNFANLQLVASVLSNPYDAVGISPGTTPLSTLGGQFQRLTVPQPGSLVLASSSSFPSIGQCVVRTPVFTMAQTVTTSAPVDSTTLSPLNAGSALNVTGPNGKGSALLSTSQPGTYAGTLGAGGVNAPPFIPSAGGLFTIDNGSGGSDVGPFTTPINVPPPLVWSNIGSITVIDRFQPLTITWTGGDPAGVVTIQGGYPLVVTPTETVLAQITCTAPVPAQQFTIPPSALMALPPLPVSTTSAPQFQLIGQRNFLFTAPGLDGGVISAQAENTLIVPYQ